MDGAILAIFKENTITFGIASFIVLIGAAVKTATGFLNFYEEFLVKRYTNRLDSLSKDLDTDSITSQYIKALRKNEVFRIASGIECYPEKAKMLMEIYLLGVASKGELKRLSRYFKPENNRLSITVDWCDKVIFIYSFISMLTFFSLGFHVALSSLLTGKLIQIVSGVVIMFIFMLIGIIAGRDCRVFSSLKRVRDRLLELNMLTNPNDSIEWNITLWSRRPEVSNVQNE